MQLVWAHLHAQRGGASQPASLAADELGALRLGASAREATGSAVISAAAAEELAESSMREVAAEELERLQQSPCGMTVTSSAVVVSGLAANPVALCRLGSQHLVAATGVRLACTIAVFVEITRTCNACSA